MRLITDYSVVLNQSISLILKPNCQYNISDNKSLKCQFHNDVGRETLYSGSVTWLTLDLDHDYSTGVSHASNQTLRMS